MTALTLIVRSGCTLCEAMQLELQAFRGHYPLVVQTLDVDSDPTLVEKYNDRVPVLLAGERELCCYFLDTEHLILSLGL